MKSNGTNHANIQHASSSIHGPTNQSSTGSASAGSNNSDFYSTFSFPPELKKILLEVATTGKCSSLPWTASETNSFYAKRSREYLRELNNRTKHEKGNLNSARSEGEHNVNALNHHHDGPQSNTNKLNNQSTNINTSSNDIPMKKPPLDESKEVLQCNIYRLASNATTNAHAESLSTMTVETASMASQGSKRSVDVSTTVTAQSDIRRRQFYRNQSYASSCSESVSSAGGGSTMSIPSSSASMGPLSLSLPFRTLRGALRLAVALVLEYSYKHRGGYKLSLAEKRKFEVLAIANTKVNAFVSGKTGTASSYHPSRTDIAFMERRMRLLKMLGGGKSAQTASRNRFGGGAQSGSTSDGGFTSDTSMDTAAFRRKITTEDFLPNGSFGPPFTVQRLAEVLLAPERCYVQTHKLCNALEKLLLVTLPSTAFGGVTGGDTSQNRREEQEMAALANKKERDETEQVFRNNQLKRKLSSSSYDGGDPIIEMNVSVETPESRRRLSYNSKPNLGSCSGLPLSVSMYQQPSMAQNYTSKSQDHEELSQSSNQISPSLYHSTNQGINHMDILIQGGTAASSSEVAYLDHVEVGRFSASNSDIDSESDDISFDDSASDRSDGSDFDSALNIGVSEPFTAARVMALNRMQQQHRREQYLQDRASRQVTASGAGPNFHPPADYEYQSGDSVDSNMAEDSCGSDSSSQGDTTD